MFCHRLRHRLTVDFASQQSTLQPAPTHSSDQHPRSNIGRSITGAVSIWTGYGERSGHSHQNNQSIWPADISDDRYGQKTVTL